MKLEYHVCHAGRKTSVRNDYKQNCKRLEYCECRIFHNVRMRIPESFKGGI